MTEAARLEQSLSDVERERFDLAAVVAGCVDGYRQAYPGARIALARPDAKLIVDGAPDLVAQMLDKLVANAVEFGKDGASTYGLAREGDKPSAFGQQRRAAAARDAGRSPVRFDGLGARRWRRGGASRTWGSAFTSCG